jgi:tetratricopeptide (TPR) repeat protein
MPQFALQKYFTLGALTLLSACATTHHNSESSIFFDSAGDVADRAPAAMAIPPQQKEGSLIDQNYMRGQADYHFTLADTYGAESNTARAIEEYKLVLVYDPKSAVVRLRLAAEYVKQGMVNEGIQQAKTAIELEPQMADAHLLLGGLFSALKMYDDALSSYNEVLKINPESVEAPLFIGALLAELKRYDESIHYFEKLAKNPKNKNPYLAHFYIGRIQLEQAGQKPSTKAFAKVETAFKKSIQLKPSFVDVYLALGQLYESNNKKDLAVTTYKSFEEKNDPDAAIAENLARIYLADEEMEKAFQQYEIMESADSSNLNVKVKIAFILIEQKKYPEAIVKLEDILGRAPYSDKIRFYLGAVYEETKDFSNAISQFKLIPVNSSYYVESIVHTSYLYKMKNDYQKAVESVQAGIKNKPDQPQLYALYASFLDDQKEFKKAVEMLSQAVDRFPKHAQLNFFLGSMQDRLGNTSAVISTMKKVLDIDGNHIQALNYLAYTYADHNLNLDDAEKLAKHANELQPNDGFIMDTLGWIQFKIGHTSDAIRTLEAAYKMQPTESVIAEHLGDAYYSYQLPEKAKKMYLRATEIESNLDVARKIRAKIVSIDQQKTNVQVFKSTERQPASSESTDPSAEQK